MAKKSSNRAYAGMGSIRGGSKEVNPTFSLKKAPVATPASKTQVNPTFSAGKSTGPKATPGRRLNPTFAVANPGAEMSKGKSGPKFVAMKSKVGKPLATTKHPQPVKMGLIKSNKGGADLKGLKTPTRNIKGGIGKGPKANSASKVHSVKGSHDVTVPTRNEMAPFGPNGKAAAPMTVARLKKMGY